ncbi:pectinesterase family protein [Mangrovibacterium sp.]|uniref:pectinesterase family protein n=1 Tax=Mangrovibacterium sp. TaxID=1961364 RepID=UPI003566B5B7
MTKLALLFLFLLSNLLGKAENDTKYNLIVSQDGSGDFTHIQDAIDATKAFPDKRISIFIKNGIYREKVLVPSWNTLLSLVGENVEKTIVIWDDYFDKIGRGRNSTFFTYTLKIEADDFFAKNLTIKNTAGPVGQAVALHVEGNRCVFKNCILSGNQDTAYLSGENSNQLFQNCTIEGTTDFIFGSATVVFYECSIISKANSFTTAASTPKGKEFGFVFLKCWLHASENVSEVYLGRPWRPYAKTVFIRCELGDHIVPEGWKEWSNKDNLSTTYYGEYMNTGTGANLKNRVNWSFQLSKKQAKKYAVQKILGDWANTFQDD